MAPDPYGQFHSPYIAMGNIPTIIVDPNGGIGENHTKGSDLSTAAEAGINGDCFGCWIAADFSWVTPPSEFRFLYGPSGGGSSPSAGYEGDSWVKSGGGGSGGGSTRSGGATPKELAESRERLKNYTDKLVAKGEGHYDEKGVYRRNASTSTETTTSNNTETKRVSDYYNPKYQTNGQFDPIKVEIETLKNMKFPEAKKKYASGAPPPSTFKNPAIKYGGDGSGDALDMAHRAAYYLNQYNPVANVWDATTGYLYGTDRYGNSQSLFESNLKLASVFPTGKGGSLFIKGFGAVDQQLFHTVLKKDILKSAGNYSKIVGNNPDIGVKNGIILLHGTGPFKGKTFETGLKAFDFLSP